MKLCNALGRADCKVKVPRANEAGYTKGYWAIQVGQLFR